MRKASISQSQHRQEKILEASSFILALWQLRKTWRLLLLTGLGMLSAVVLVCAVPLYTHVATTLGLRQVLSSPQSNSTLIISSRSQQISPQIVQTATQDINTLVRNNLGPYLTTSSEFSLEMLGGLSRTPVPSANTDQVQLIGSSMTHASSHVHLIQGRLPLTTSTTIEIALTPQQAERMHAKVGDVFTTSVSYGNTSRGDIQRQTKMTLVGLFLPSGNDSFWHQQTFQSTPLLTQAGNFTLYKALVSNDAVLSVLAHIAAEPDFPGPAKKSLSGPVLQNELHFYWYYSLDSSHIDVDNLNDVESKLQTVLLRITPFANAFVYGAYVQQTASSSYAPTVLTDYSRRLTVANIPILSLTFLVVSLILFFVSIMTDILVEAHTTELAVLRSRGASLQQLLSSLLLQGIGLGGVAFVFGLPLALIVVFLLTQITLLPGHASALPLVTQHLWSTLQAESLSAACVVGAALVAMSVSLLRVAQLNVLVLRRETSRSTRRPLWARLYLDVLAALVAFLGFLYTLYLTSPNVLDTRTRILILSPLTLLSSLLFLVCCVFLLLRFFSLLLRSILWLAERGQSTSLLLAVTQMARTPRHVLRQALLLSLVLAFTLFTLIFTASQTQRVADVAAHQVGADFSGTLPARAATSLKSQSAAYAYIPGVTSATCGYTNSTSTEANGSSIAISLLAVDTDTYARTAIWTRQNSSQPLPQLLQQLAGQRQTMIENVAVPALVDATTWQVLHLQRGIAFSITDTSTSIQIVPIAEVAHLPTVNDIPEATNSIFSSAGGILVDYQTYAAVFTTVAQRDPSNFTNGLDTNKTTYVGPTMQLNHVWLRTSDDLSTLIRVRLALQQGSLQLDAVADRRELVDILRNDPLYRGLLGVLLLGVVATLLLALVEDVTTSWLGARQRLLNVTVLRALGTTPGQITSMLLWEQGIVYSIALGLGISFGVLFSIYVLPSLILTSVNASQLSDIGANTDLYALQSVPPVQIIIPSTLLLELCGVVVLYMVVSGIFMRIFSRSSTSQVLRLNED